MAYWDGSQVIGFEPTFSRTWMGWIEADHGCCNGIKWGGEYPRECECAAGVMYVHIESGTIAQYPGGPLMGARLKGAELARLIERAQGAQHKQAC